MNRYLWLFLSFACLAYPQGALKNYWQNRFDAKDIQVQDVEGFDQHITDGKLHLQIQYFLALVLHNSPDIQLTRLDIYNPIDQLISAHSPFDPALNLNFNTFRSVEPLTFSISGTPGGSQFTLPQTVSSLSETSVLDYKQLLPTGQTVETTFTGYRSSGDGYAYPSIFGNLNFQITQPLLQNRTNIQNLAPIRIAKTEILITAKQSEATINTNMAQIARQYWDAVLARDTIKVNQQSLDLARKSYDHDKQALDLGAISKLDILQSESQVAERERELVQAQYQYKVLLDGLRRLMGADLTPRTRALDIVLDDDPAALPDKANILPFEQALTKALAARPEMAAASAAISVDELSARVSRDALRPRLDLGLTGGSSGPGENQISSGSVIGLGTSTPPPGLGPTLQQVFQFRYPSYGGSLTATFPFRNSTAKANLSDALVSRARDRYRQRQAQEQITLDVRQATHNIELADATIQAAIHARDLAHQNVDAEQQKYQLGATTAFELLTAQSSLATAESALVNAYVNYQEAYIDYQRATETLLTGFGMIVSVPTSH